jgi:hypothetical protein
MRKMEDRKIGIQFYSSTIKRFDEGTSSREVRYIRDLYYDALKCLEADQNRDFLDHLLLRAARLITPDPRIDLSAAPVTPL